MSNTNNEGDTTPRKTAFVLSGGGARGSFQVGVLKQLLKKGIVPHAMFGTSVGALNAAGVAYIGVDELEQVWLNIQRNSDILRFQTKSILFSTRGLYSTEPLHNIIKKFVKGYPITGIHPYACVSNLYSGQTVYVDPWTCEDYGMTFAESVLASASIPLAMEPVLGVWVDGGVREIVPLREAILKGYTDIYVIMCSPWEKDPKPMKEIKNWLFAGARTLDLLTHEIFVNDVRTCMAFADNEHETMVDIHLYAPKELVIDTLEFNPLKIRKNIQLGFDAQEIEHDFIRALV